MAAVNVPLNLKAQPAGRILVLRPDEIGDVVMTIPFLRELRRSFPQAGISLLVKPETADLVRSCPYVNRIFVYDWERRRPRARAALYSILHLWGRQDLVLLPRWDADFYSAALLARWSGARRRVSYSQHVCSRKNEMNPHFDECFTHLLDSREVKHEVERSLDMLTYLGGTVESDRLEIWTDAQDEAYASRNLSEDQRSCIGLGVGSRNAKRTWPVENFVELGRRLIAKDPFRLVVVGGAEDASAGAQLKSALGNGVINLAGGATLRQTAAVLKRCRLFVGNDTGAMHLAAAGGVPVVEISCHPETGSPLHYNSPARFGPWGVPSAVIRPDRGRDNCIEGCDSASAHCILSIDVDRVEHAALDLFNRTWPGKC